MANPTITVDGTQVTITVGGGGGGSLTPLVPSPAGQYDFANVTVDQYGRVTEAAQNNDVASELTQQQILVTVETVNATLSGGFAGQPWDNNI